MLRIGETAEFFTNFQEESGPSRIGKVVAYHSQGLPFILGETEEEKDQVVYTYDIWVVLFGTEKQLAKKRRVYRIGISTYNVSRDILHTEALCEDRFLEVNGYEIY